MYVCICKYVCQIVECNPSVINILHPRFPIQCMHTIAAMAPTQHPTLNKVVLVKPFCESDEDMDIDLNSSYNFG